MTIAIPKSPDDIRSLIADMPGPDTKAADAADAREPQLTKPPGALGRLEELARWAAAWQRKHPATADNITVRIFAGNHGVTAKGVSAFPADVTVQMVGNFAAGGAAINQLCRSIGANLDVIALDLDNPTADFSEDPAMSDSEIAHSFAAGMAAVDPASDLLCIGEMGIGNTTAAAAIAMALFEGDAADWVGPGTGVAGDALDNKTRVVAASVALHSGDAPDGVDILARLGGRELAAMAGAVCAARYQGVPVILDGYVATAAAATIRAVRNDGLAHCVAGHVSREPGHRRLLDALGMAPLLDLDMRLGEGSGAALAAAIVKGAIECHRGMATFAEAGVSDKEG